MPGIRHRAIRHRAIRHRVIGHRAIGHRAIGHRAIHLHQEMCGSATSGTMTSPLFQLLAEKWRMRNAKAFRRIWRLGKWRIIMKRS